MERPPSLSVAPLEQHLEARIERDARLRGNRKDLVGGRSLRRRAAEAGCDGKRFVATALISMFSRCGSMADARDVFERMSHSDVVSWNVLILGYVANGESAVALELFRRMDCAPNRVSFVAGLKACAGLAAEKRLDKRSCLEKGVAIHAQAKAHGFNQETYVSNTFLDTCIRCGDILLAREHFETMLQRDVVSWNILILGYVENGQSITALQMFHDIDCPPNRITIIGALKACLGLASHHNFSKEKSLQRGQAIHRRARATGLDKDLRVANTLVDVYSKLGHMKLARECFDGILRRDVVSWNVLIHGYVENEEYTVALEVFHRMDSEPNCFTYVGALKACAGLAGVDKLKRDTCLQKGMGIHREARKRRVDGEVYVSNTLVDMYSKCGDMAKAREVFDGMTTRDAVAWTSLILGYVDNGESSKALDVINTLDCQLDTVVLVAALKACRALGAVDVGRGIHSEACRAGVVEEETLANSLVDFYVKAGRLTSAEFVFDCLDRPSVVSWTALAGGYSSLGETGEVFRLVEGMEEAGLRVNGVTMLLVLTACRHAGMVEEGRRRFESMGSKYGVSPSLEHYACMVDMLGRANRVQEALSLVKSMPFEADSVVWMSLLGSCTKWSDVEAGMIKIYQMSTKK